MTPLAPRDEADLAEAIAGAAAAGTPVEITGGATRPVGRPVQARQTLSTAALSGITLYEPGALTLVVQAGTPVAEIETALAAEGQMLPFEPVDHRTLLGTEGTPTIGGAVAVATSGPRRIQKGAIRDFMLGVRFVDGIGQIVSNGGRVMKNVTGYDLVKLMAGAHGTLGALSEIAFKVLPAPQATATLSLDCPEPDRGVSILADALGTPFDVAGAAWLNGRALIRLEGLEHSVAYRSQALATALSGQGTATVETDRAANTRLWSDIRDVAPFAGQEGAVWRISTRPSDGPRLVSALAGDLTVHDHFHDWAGGLTWLRVDEDGDAGAAAIRTRLTPIGGHATLLRASPATRAAVDVFEPEPTPLAAIATGLRSRFDPKGILNPGRMRA